MSKYVYNSEDFSFAKYNRKAIKIYDSAETNKDKVQQMIYEAVQDFFSKNKDVDYFGAYYYPSQEDLEYAIQLCYFLEIKEKVSNIDLSNKKEISKRLIWNEDYNFLSKLHRNKKVLNLYHIKNPKGLRILLEQASLFLYDLNSINNLYEISEGTLFYILLEEWVSTAIDIEFGMGKINEIIENEFMGLAINLNNIHYCCLSKINLEKKNCKFIFQQQLEMANVNFKNASLKLKNFIDRSLK